jgi:F-type H+-transporting ATPase subunit gamma
MPSLRQIRSRIRSVQNTEKITRAMQMVASVKMRRAQLAALASRSYTERLSIMLSNIVTMSRDDLDEVNPLLQIRDEQNVTLIHITPDRGLCGALIGNVNKQASDYLIHSQKTKEVSVITVGRKGNDFIKKITKKIDGVFAGLGDRPILTDISPIADLIIEAFISGSTDAVYIGYSEFVNTVNQTPVLKRLLPIEPAEIATEESGGFIYEPGPMEIIDAMLPRYIRAKIYQGVRESIASEESARMVAMRNATDNANEMGKDLKLQANKLRQASITAELLDIISGTLSIEGK